VAPDGAVSVRAVQIAQAVSGQWVVLSGLKAGEQVMVDGFQKLRGNTPVKPVPWKSPPEATPTPGTPGTTGAKP
ncbi:efflux transporter periplasmic adaptor subunit, partial [Staphylococcus sp. GDX7P312P]